MIAALIMGAEGMNIGTSFISTHEALVHVNVKHALLVASELDTRLIMRFPRSTERALNDAAMEKVIEIGKTKSDEIRIEDTAKFVGGWIPRSCKKELLTRVCGIVEWWPD